jgi:cell division protein FtsQ
MAVSDDLAPWEDEMPWTDMGQSTPQPFRKPTAAGGAVAAREQDALQAALAAQRAATVRAAQEQAAREQAAAERAAQERAAQARAAQERAAQERAAQERAAQERAAAQRAANDKQALAQAERLHAAREQAARELAARRQAERDQAERDQAERDEAAREQQAREQAARDQLARERAEVERLARQQAERERAEQERLELERAEHARAEREQAERRAAALEQVRHAAIAAQAAAAAEAAAQAAAAREAEQRQAKARAQAERVAEREVKAAAARQLKAQEQAQREQAAREQAAAEQAESERKAREQAARAEADRAERAEHGGPKGRSRKSAGADATDAGSPPRFEALRRPPPAAVADAPGREAQRSATRAGWAANPVDQAVAQALDLRLMQMASHLLLSLALLALVGWGLVWLASGPWFAFKSLTVLGQRQHSSADLLRSEVLSKLHGGFFTLDLQQARREFESLPWVRKAQVKRVWPDRLVVTLDEHQPRAVWEHEDVEDQLVDLQGNVFDGSTDELDDSVSQNLPVLRGPAGSARQMLAMHQRLTPVFGGLKTELSRLELSERGSWRATLANRSVIELGRGEPAEVEQRTRRFVATVAEVSARFGQRAVESADLRHQDGYALKLVGMGTSPRPAGAGKSR